MKKSKDLNELITMSFHDCVIMGHESMTESHLIYTGIMIHDSSLIKILEACGCNLNSMVNSLNTYIDSTPIALTGLTKKTLKLSNTLNDVLTSMQLLVESDGRDVCEVYDFLGAILINGDNKLKTIIYDSGFEDEKFKLLNTSDLDDEIEENTQINIHMGDNHIENLPIRNKNSQQQNKMVMLEANGKNLNTLAKEGKIQDIVGREKELNRIMTILMHKKKRNPMVIGDAGVGKTGLVEALAKKIVDGNVHKYFKNKEVYLLDLVSIVSGTKYRGEFEKKMIQILKEIEENPNVIVFIDEIHQLVGSGSTQGSMDGANILKPALSRGDVQIIGATTNAEFNKHFADDLALVRRFQKVQLNEPTEEETINILNKSKDEYQQFHKVNVSEELIIEAVKLSGRLVVDRKFPDKAFDVLDALCANINNERFHESFKDNKGVYDEYAELKQRTKELDKEITRATNLNDYEGAAKVRDKLRDLQARLNIVKSSITELETSDAEENVATREDLLKVISVMSGVSLESLTETSANYLSNLEGILNKKVIGQPEAVSALCDGIMRQQTKVKDPNKPLVYLFLGQTGVGKTLIVKELAKEVYGSASNFVRVNMSDYQDSYTVSNLTGSAKGYVGSDSGSFLYNKIKEQPRSVILLDEIEKAHPNVFNAFLQIFDEGEAVDKNGEKISFRECVIVMTSNIGMREISETKNYNIFNNNDSIDATKKESILQAELKKKFAPEVLNRIGKIVTFNNISSENAELITDLEIDKISKRLKDNKKKITVLKPLRTKIIEDGYSDEYGARNIGRTIEKLIEIPLARYMVLNPDKESFKLTFKDEEVLVS